LSGLFVRELFYDYVEGRLPAIYRADIDSTIQSLLRTGQIMKKHIAAAVLYCAGYTILELQSHVPDIENILVTFFSLLSENVQYHDEILLQIWLNNGRGDAKTRRYIRAQKQKTADAWRNKIEEASRSFI